MNDETQPTEQNGGSKQATSPSEAGIQQHEDDSNEREPHYGDPYHKLAQWLCNAPTRIKAGWNKTEFHNKVSIVLTCLIALATLVYVAATIVYVIVAAKTLSEIKSSGGKASEQTDKIIAAAEKFAASAATQASASRTQAEASLRSAQAQETANRLVSRQFEIMQSSDLALAGRQSLQGVTWEFKNTGKADITDLVIRRETQHFNDRQAEDCREFDPIKYLDEFRLDPDRYTRKWMEDWQRAWKSDPSVANDRGLKSAMSPHMIYKRIHQGEGVSFGDMFAQGDVAVTFEFFLADWDDPFGHHSDQFCDRVEGAPTNLQILSCSAPIGYASSKKPN